MDACSGIQDIGAENGKRAFSVNIFDLGCKIPVLDKDIVVQDGNETAMEMVPQILVACVVTPCEALVALIENDCD